MACYIGYSMNLSFTITLLLVSLSVMARQSIGIESSVAGSLAKSDDFQICASKLGKTCGDSISQYVFGVGKEVSKECCNRLLTVGEDCHDLLTEASIVYKRLQKKQAKDAWAKNNKVWEHCTKVGVMPSGGKTDDFKKCATALGPTCGDIIYHNIFGESRHVSKECCSRLSTVGEDCHDLLTEASIVSERVPKDKVGLIWYRNEKVWERCNHI